MGLQGGEFQVPQEEGGGVTEWEGAAQAAEVIKAVAVVLCPAISRQAHAATSLDARRCIICLAAALIRHQHHPWLVQVGLVDHCCGWLQGHDRGEAGADSSDDMRPSEAHASELRSKVPVQAVQLLLQLQAEAQGDTGR